MKSYQLDITLQEDLVLSATASTLGGNHSLDYIPGSALLGAAAATLYSQLPQETAFHVFHSGAVRFGNAYPVQRGEASRPIPLAWHRLKVRGGSTQLINHLQDCSGNVKVKQEQLRHGFVTVSGELLYPLTSFRMKTAIDPNTATAATAQLFGYESLQAGQTFRARLDIEDNATVTETVIDSLINTLHGSLLLGRSRSAQYGEAVCDVTPIPDEPVPCNAVTAQRLVLWLQSDLALQDDYGQPVLTPEAKYFGVEGTLDAARSFLRYRSYSPYNSYRRSYDTVRQVITQGSVISFNLNSPVSEAVQKSWSAGIGQYRECGLGQVLVNPPLLEQPVPIPSVVKPSDDVLGAAPDHPLAKWLLSQTQSGGLRRRLREQAEHCAGELEALYQSARRYAGESSGVLVGPGRSQWGKVSEVAKQYAAGGQSEDLLLALFGENNRQAVCSESGAGWQTATGSGATDTFTLWLKDKLEQETANPGLLAANLAQIARSVVAKQEAAQ